MRVCMHRGLAEFEKDDGGARPTDERREAEAEAGSVNGNGRV